MSEYNAYEIGRDLWRRGLGMSDTWAAVRCDADVDACIQGFLDQQQEEYHVNSGPNS